MTEKVPNLDPVPDFEPELKSKLQTLRRQDNYARLGLKAGATAKDAKAAFASMVKRYHPDLFQQHGPLVYKLSEDIFKLLNEAHIALNPPPPKPLEPMSITSDAVPLSPDERVDRMKRKLAAEKALSQAMTFSSVIEALETYKKENFPLGEYRGEDFYTVDPEKVIKKIITVQKTALESSTFQAIMDLVAQVTGVAKIRKKIELSAIITFAARSDSNLVEVQKALVKMKSHTEIRAIFWHGVSIPFSPAAQAEALKLAIGARDASEATNTIERVSSAFDLDVRVADYLIRNLSVRSMKNFSLPPRLFARYYKMYGNR